MTPAYGARPLVGVQRERYLAHARRAQFARALSDAHTSIHGLINVVRHPYVALSCGKDSTVMAHLARQALPTIPLRFLRSGESSTLHDVDGVLAWFRADGAIVQELLFDRVWSPEWRDADWETQRRAGRRDHEQMTQTAEDAVLLGLRAEESRVRALTLWRHRSADLPQHCYRLRSGMIRCCPLARWTIDDVGAYLALHDLPVLAWYHVHAEGLGARTTARLTGNAVRQYTLTYLKHHHLEGYRRIVRRFPELASLA